MNDLSTVSTWNDEKCQARNGKAKHNPSGGRYMKLILDYDMMECILGCCQMSVSFSS